MKYILRSWDDFTQVNKWKNFFTRFKGKLVKMINNSGGELFNDDDYWISPKIKQIWLLWGYELTEKDFLPTQEINWKIFFSLVWNMSYYQLNKKINFTKSKI